MTSNRPCTTNSGSCPTPFRVRAMLPSSRDIEWPHHAPNSIMMIILVIIQTHTYMYFPYFLYHYIFLFGIAMCYNVHTYMYLVKNQIMPNNFRNLFYWTRSESTRRCHNSFTLFAHCQK